ncbi:MAG: phosphoenolpyruvate synthase [Bdellovibrionaceae bacterium]|nr:phosphoenolpyruvate synthase [Pseudobdellovibrionaceae bacterium]
MSPVSSGVSGFSHTSLIDQTLTLEAFHPLSGTLGGIPFVKVVYDLNTQKIHFLNHSQYPFHVNYIALEILKMSEAELDAQLDDFNHKVYLDPDRDFFLGNIALYHKDGSAFFTLETVEVDNMNIHMIREFYESVKKKVDPTIPLYFKPANHLQESAIAEVDPQIVPRVWSHELFASSHFIPLHAGIAEGRLRWFQSEDEYREQVMSIEWHDIVVMEKVPEDIPRVSGMINTGHTTPLSHTNVLASGWNIPNAIQIGIEKQIDAEKLDSSWVRYEVDSNASSVSLQKIPEPQVVPERPSWSLHQVSLETPKIEKIPVRPIQELCDDDRSIYGTKASHLGELAHVFSKGSKRLLGYYRIPRPPRENLIPYVAQLLNTESHLVSEKAVEFLKTNFKVPRGIAIPFSVQQDFLTSSWQIQQTIGRLKMALELGAKEIDTVSVRLQTLIRNAPMSRKMKAYLDEVISEHLSGVSEFVVRSSSNAEDLPGFSAAGVYESKSHVDTAEHIFESIKEVWASLVSPRSVRLREEVGIRLEDTYMGVVIQEQVEAEMSGVLVTTNPMNKRDFRNVYINASFQSTESVVSGVGKPYQFLFNTVEGGGRTLSVGDHSEGLSSQLKNQLQQLSLAGRFLQSHFSPDYTFKQPVDIEWAIGKKDIYILQIRPYVK